MPSDPDCIFCKIVTGTIPAAKVLETDSVLAFLDIAPVASGHLLVISKDHYATLAETPPEVIAGIAAQLPRLAAAVQTATDSPGLNVVQNNGRTAGQEVNHLHLHLIPRRPNDEFRVHWPRSKYEGESMAQMQEKISGAL